MARSGITESDSVRAIAKALMAARYAAVLYGSFESRSDLDLEAESLIRLVTGLNDVTRCVMLKLLAGNNSVGAEYVLSATSGFPHAVNFSRGYPRHRNLEFSTERMIERESCDALLVFDVGRKEAGWAEFGVSTPVLSRDGNVLDGIPMVQFMVGTRAQPWPQADVSIRIENRGSMLRNDGAMLSVIGTHPTAPRSDHVLNNLTQKLLDA